ncbi:MAG: transposase domain-containing protein, partial [Phycisphaerales bacterium]
APPERRCKVYNAIAMSLSASWRRREMSMVSPDTARTAATLFTLVATCERHKVEPLSYLRDVLTRIAAMPINDLEQLLPDRWQPTTN